MNFGHHAVSDIVGGHFQTGNRQVDVGIVSLNNEIPAGIISSGGADCIHKSLIIG